MRDAIASRDGNLFDAAVGYAVDNGMIIDKDGTFFLPGCQVVQP